MMNDCALQMDWEFICPQFVNFAQEILPDVVPSNNDSRLHDDSVFAGGNKLIEDESKNLRKEMLNVIQDSPFISTRPLWNPTATTSQCELSRFSHSTPSLNANIDFTIAAETKLSKNVGAGKKRKKSASFGDKPRRRINVSTPMCLKRPKRKAAVKSSEELELETIARLQRKLKDDLARNERMYRKLKANWGRKS